MFVFYSVDSGGNDHMVTSFSRMPSYEFGLQFWFQQSKLWAGQTILTWWTDSRGREFEVADTSNIFFYHMNNRSEPTGIGINDGKWYHVAFSWRLVCPPSLAIPGSTYCIEPRCQVPVDCWYVEITVFINGEIRGKSSLPPFIPSSTGYIIWGQRVLNYLGSETVYKNNLFSQLEASAPKTTSNIEVEYTDRELQLIYSRIRSNYLNDTIIYSEKLRTDTTGWVLTEDEPWRDPHFKYCEIRMGNFDPFAALSANIDEIRLYSYYRLPQDIHMAMRTSLNGDNFYSYSNPEANVSLILYLNFDLDDAGFAAQALNTVNSWPLNIVDLARPSIDLSQPSAESKLGGGIFSAAPLQIPSTAPLRGSRTVQIAVPDAQQPIPINLIDLAIMEDQDAGQLYSRIDAAPLYGELKAAADDCDSVTDVNFNIPAVGYRPYPACLGGVLVLSLTGGLSASTLTRNCSVGTNITATDGYGREFLAKVSSVDSSGTILETLILNFGRGYDWVNTERLDVIVNDGRCLCGGAPANITGNMRPCMRALVGTGKAKVNGSEFPGIDFTGTSKSFDYVPTSCNKGYCPAVKPRPCTWACERTAGWRTDLTVKPTQYNKFMAGPYTQFALGILEFKEGFESVFWSNSRHTVWYVPTSFGQAGQNYDSFLLRKFDKFPMFEILAANLDIPPPYPHVWVYIVQERLALPLNSSLIWEANSPVVVQLQFVDFDRGTSILNSPFDIRIDPPSRGFLYQAIPMNRSDPNFARDCVCRNGPRFPLLNSTPDSLYYPPGTSLPGSRHCNIDKEGKFCMRKGNIINVYDTRVTQFDESINIPGFQNTYNGFHVIYYMGDDQYGSATINWRMKHPQGQIQNAKIEIEIRKSNSPPVAINTSYVTMEDFEVQIELQGMDIDDYLEPTLYVKEYPKNGDLYQCITESNFHHEQGNSSCKLGDPINPLNDTIFQWADVQEDLAGAVDDSIVNVSIQRSAFNKNVPEITIVGPNTTTELNGGYGFGSWNFNPDNADNFKKLCGARGTVAAHLQISSPVFVTNVEIFAQLRFDTPFRILVAAPHPINEITLDYGDYSDKFPSQIEVVLDSKYNISTFDVNFGNGGREDMTYTDQSEFHSAKSFFEREIYCGLLNTHKDDRTICQSLWKNNSRIQGHMNTFSANQNSNWEEIYRGLPHQVQANKVSISPIFSPITFQASELRVEACGEEVRIFGKERRPFLAGQLIRVTGTRTHRPAGYVLDRNYRVLYVPHHNWNGNDSFSYFVQDHAGGANRSSAKFSMARGTSPLAHVSITVLPMPDTPYGTTSSISSPPSDGINSVLISLAGIQAAPHGDFDPIKGFHVQIINYPVNGRLFDESGKPFTGGVVDSVRFQPPANVCGRPFDSFRYRLEKVTLSDSVISSSVYSVTIEIRCSAGYVCNLMKQVCEPCPTGRFGRGSGIQLLCFLCPPGKYQDQVGSTLCLTCGAGFFSAYPGSTVCSPCPAGTVNTLHGSSACNACQPGTYSPIPAATMCHDCGQHAFTRVIGSITCSDCPLNTQTRSDTSRALKDCECAAGFYVLGSTGMACLPCPHGAYCHGRDLLPVPRTGYWTAIGLWTQSSQTSSADGRWAPLNTSGIAYFIPCIFRYIRGVCVGYPDINVQEAEEICQYRNSIVHQGPNGFDYFSSDGINPILKICTLLWPDEVYEVGPADALRPWIERQRYSADYFCANGYADFMCSKCAVGYDRSLSSYCQPCSILFQVPFIGLCLFLAVVAFSILGWVCLFAAVSYRARSFHLFVSHLQLLAILGRLAVPWPRLTQGFLNFCSWFNVNIDSLDWNCMSIDIELYSSRWYLDAAIPLSALIVNILFTLWSLRQAYATLRSAKIQAAERARNTRKRRSRNESAANVFRASLGRIADDQEISQMQPDNRSFTTVESSSFKSVETVETHMSSDSDVSSESAASGVSKGTINSRSLKKKGCKEHNGSQRRQERDTIMPVTSKDIRKIQDAGIQFMLITINLFYVMALITVFTPWPCSEVKVDFSYLDWSPAFVCNTPQHATMKLASFVFGVIWIVVFPAIMLYILWTAWQMELIRDRIFVRRFGWLIEPYEIKYFWWELAVLARKTVVASAQGIFTQNGYLQLVVILTYCCFHLGMTCYCRPHIQTRHTVIDMWLQIQFLILCAYAFTNIIGQDGMEIVNILFGLQNKNSREKILPTFPDMDAMADSVVNSSVISTLAYFLVMGFSFALSFFMIGFDVYRIRPSAPAWAPYIYNAITGLPLERWNHDVSKGMAWLDEFVRGFKEKDRVVPPGRPPSRWAHRVTDLDGEVAVDKYLTSSSLKAMINDAIVSSQNEEWSRNKESTIEYIRSLERRIFASEMYSSASPNLPHLERERNNAKKVLLHFVQLENEQVFQKLYDQTGRNEKLMWDILEAKRREKLVQVEVVGKQEEKMYIEKQHEEQQRRVIDARKWKVAYEVEKKHSKVFAYKNCLNLNSVVIISSFFS